MFWRRRDDGEAAEARYRALREQMVARQIEARGVSAAPVLEALNTVPRHAFVRPGDVRIAYADRALAIGHGQTISQPFVVALTLQAMRLEPSHVVLEIGTGSGYCAALLGHICREVHTVERLQPLADRAAQVLAEQGMNNVHVHCADGTLGWPDGAPYDAIAVSAGGPRVPEALLAQLGASGRVVIPVGPHRTIQELVVVEKGAEGSMRRQSLLDVRFVPLIGKDGWGE